MEALINRPHISLQKASRPLSEGRVLHIGSVEHRAQLVLLVDNETEFVCFKNSFTDTATRYLIELDTNQIVINYKLF